MERKQFIKIVLPLRPKLISNAYKFLHDSAEAEDITQEVILRLWSMRDKLAQYGSVEALSFTINRNLCLDRIKAQKRNDLNLTTETISIDTHSPDVILEQKDDAGQVIRIIDQLPDLQQMILKMKHVEGLDNKEIEEITGCTQEAIRANLSRARKKVKDIFLKMQNYG